MTGNTIARIHRVTASVPLVGPNDFIMGATGFALETVRKEGICFITISDLAAMGSGGRFASNLKGWRNGAGARFG
jgi:hypothetical protein